MALVIVLAFVVLLTGLVLAFFSRALSDRQISNSSATQTRVQLLADGATATIIGDLKQEIADGSSQPFANPTPGVYLYRPNVPAAVPAYQMKTGSMPVVAAGKETDGLNNVLKCSGYGVPFYVGSAYANTGPNRAANVSTLAPSTNGRFVSLARWNKPLLMQSKTATDPTPAASVKFTSPDWILVGRDGTNPKMVGASVTGRYAYTIYNEGGLLDANVAGYSTATTAYPATNPATLPWLPTRKSSLAYADLTVPIPLDPTQANGGTQPLLTGAQINALVGWRNYASGQTTGAFPAYTPAQTPASAMPPFPSFDLSLLGDVGGLMGTRSATLWNNQSDRGFSGRQELINFLTQSVPSDSADGSPPSRLQHALQYLGTFSRSLNQPSVYPDPNRPQIVGPALQVPDSNPSSYTGGNSAYGTDSQTGRPLQDIFNPAVRSILATPGLIRNDGSVAEAGEPLVKKRFALNRLLWLTYKGPSSKLSPTDPLFTEYQKSGMSAQLVERLRQEGTDANILAYFGLTWQPGPGGPLTPGGYWVYDHGFNSSGTVGLLRDVAATTPKREPDFFELLKASVVAGSLAKAWLGIQSGTLEPYYPLQDSTVTPHIMALGANIIDGANPTQYPTHIAYTFTSGDIRHVYGAMDLPYVTADWIFTYICQNPSPVSADGQPEASTTAISTTPSQGYYVPSAGTGVMMAAPVIWNAYDSQGPRANSTLAPSKVRVVISNPLPTLDSSPTTWPPVAPWLLSGAPWYALPRCYYSDPPPKGSSGTTITPTPPSTTPITYQMNQPSFASNWTSEESTALIFNNDPSLYREPTLLNRPNTPAGSSLGIDSTQNIMALINGTWQGGIPEAGSGLAYIGALVSTFPLRWTAKATQTNPSDPTIPAYYIYTTDAVASSNPKYGFTWRVEYQSPSGAWIPYRDTYTTGAYDGMALTRHSDNTAAAPSLLGPLRGVSSSIPYFGTWDPLGNRQPTGVINAGASNNGYQRSSAYSSSFDPRTSRWPLLLDMTDAHFLDTTPAAGPPSTNMMETDRPVATGGGGTHSSIIAGMHRDPNNGPAPGYLSQNLYGANYFYYADADGTTRRAMGGYVQYIGTGSGPTAKTTVGLPLASNYPASATNVTNRPVILHRPYRSVAELGTVLRDTPWKNIDFFSAESGDTALLDVFCINEEARPDALVAGKVDLNTRQTPVLAALFAGVYRDAASTVTNGTIPTGNGALSVPEATALATALVKRTASGNGTVPAQPLSNIGDVVGRYVANYSNSNFQPYDGFSEDVTNQFQTGIASGTQTAPTNPGGSFNIIQRHREAAIRALSDTGMAGTWNLLIDVVAQTGRYPAGATALSNFLVEGERRVWVHVAIDRQSGQVIDQQIEPISE